MKGFIRKTALFSILLTITILCCIGCGTKTGKEDNEEQKGDGIVETILAHKGYVRVVEKQEYELYEQMTDQEPGSSLTKEERDRQVQEKAARINAVFYLGNILGLYEPFSLEVLQMRLEQENTERKIKLEKGEPVYGLQQFELQSYLEYEMSNLELDIKLYLYEHITEEELGDKPEQFYYDNEQGFRSLESITYEETREGKTEKVVADKDMIRTMGRHNPLLGDFFSYAKVGDVYENPGETKQVIKITGIEYGPMGYEYHKDTAVKGYVDTILFHELVDAIAANNPLEYRLQGDGGKE